MAEHEAERELLVEALVLLRQRQAELEQRIFALEQALPSSNSSREPSPALRGLVEDLRAAERRPLPAPHEAASQTSSGPPKAEASQWHVLRPRHLDSALIALGVLVLVYAGLYQLAQALGFG